MTTPYAFDADGARRIVAATRAVERHRPDDTERAVEYRPPSELVPFVRVPKSEQERDDTGGDEVNAQLIAAVILSESIEADWQQLPVPCGHRDLSILDGTPRFLVDQQAFFEGIILPGGLFVAVELGHQWYALGACHTAVAGVYAEESVAIGGCGEAKVPAVYLAQPIIPLAEPTVLAGYVTAQRKHVIAAFACEAQ